MIEKFAPEHISPLVQIIKKLSPQYFAPSEIDDYVTYLQDETEDYFVIEKQGKIVGGGGINYEPNHAVLSWDLIDPAFHGQQLGAKLVAYRIEFIQTKGYKKVIVRTSQLTEAFYAKMGFSTTFSEKDFWAPGYDLKLMERKL